MERFLEKPWTIFDLENFWDFEKIRKFLKQSKLLKKKSNHFKNSRKIVRIPYMEQFLFQFLTKNDIWNQWFCCISGVIVVQRCHTHVVIMEWVWHRHTIATIHFYLKQCFLIPLIAILTFLCTTRGPFSSSIKH